MHDIISIFFSGFFFTLLLSFSYRKYPEKNGTIQSDHG